MMRLTKHLVLIAFYALLALIVLYNPIFHSATHVPGDATAATDYYHFHWNYWWMRHALTNGLNIYQTDYVFAPFTSGLVYHTLTPSYFPIWALLEPLVGTSVAMNAIVALIFTLTGYCFYLLLRHEGVAVPLALASGAILELSPLMFSGLYWTNINVMSWFWLPVLVLIWSRIVQTESRRRILWTLVLALALWGMLLTDLQYPLFAFFVVLPYALWTLIRSRQPLPLLAHGLAAGGLALLLLWFAGPLPYVLSASREGFSPTPVERAARVPFPHGFFTRIQYGASPGALVIPALLIGLLVSVRQRRAGRLRWSAPPLFWLIIAIPPLLLSAGASITIAGVEIPMPYQLLHSLLGGMFRYPERFAAVFTIPALIAAGQLFTRAYPTLSRARTAVPLGAALVLLVAAEARIFQPQPIQPLPTPYSFHQAMANEPYQYVVLDVPTAGSSGEGYVGDPRWMTTQFYALAHHKRVVNGHISRVNTWNYMYMETSDPTMAWLGQRRYLEPETVEAQLRERIFSWPIGYIVIHQNYVGREGPTLQEIIGYFNQLDDLLCFYTQEGDALVYRTAWHPDGCDTLTRTPPELEPGVYEVDIGSTGDERFIGWGYHPQEQVAGLTLRWTGEYPQTDTYVDLPPGSYTLTATLQAFWENRHVSLRVNGTEVGEAVEVGTGGLADYHWTIPADIIGDGWHLQVTLAYDDVIVPVDVGQSADQRRLAVAVDRLQFARE
jgi:hypothetical protein